MTKDFCKRHNIGLVDIRLGLFEVGDLMGMPRTEDNRTVYDKPIWFPEPRTQEGLKIACNRIRATGKKRGWTNEEITKEMRNIQESCKSAGILLLDELNRASRETLQGVFQLVYDRRINTHILPKGWWIVVCGNPEGSDYFVE
ncbi:MAG: AAA family ATPase, partial [Proteobacteria bacterium]|nr:AAA family ATPase [Pseudomonadota bacterium]